MRRVSQQGSIKWNGERTFISDLFGHEPLGLRPVDERWLRIYYGPVPLGWLDGHRHRFSRRLPRELKGKNLLNETGINTSQSITAEVPRSRSPATAQPQA